MNNISDNENKYPQSTSNNKCIGPCYYPGTVIIHPSTLQEITADEPFCPTNKYLYTDPNTQEIKEQIIDRCHKPVAKRIDSWKELEYDMLFPKMDFTSEYFIKIFYEIMNFDDCLKFLDENKSSPFKTKERIFNNAVIVFHDDIDMVDHRFANIVHEIMIYYIDIIYKKLNIYILVTDKEITLSMPSDKNIVDDLNNKNDKKYKNKIDYIKNKLLNIENVHQFMSKFIRYYKDKLEEHNLSLKLVDYMIEYIIKKIEMTI